MKVPNHDPLMTNNGNSSNAKPHTLCREILLRFSSISSIKHFGQATPLLLTVAVIELSDIAFAVDSIPVVFGVTRDPFIVFSSNLFAILGLRSLYTLISESMSELEYLQIGLQINQIVYTCQMPSAL
ncbi:hypothetical protein L2E82_42569 [Cichorium intybus]|uniref:Uncharacterized protein n=1 Tax=Cichorium intybus TaxID=13427 RepID=A0ACB8ZLS4_CICIN|nr:hypothetical protein L2E82_42569 [Cichorium intybus]